MEAATSQAVLESRSSSSVLESDSSSSPSATEDTDGNDDDEGHPVAAVTRSATKRRGINIMSPGLASALDRTNLLFKEDKFHFCS